MEYLLGRAKVEPAVKTCLQVANRPWVFAFFIKLLAYRFKYEHILISIVGYSACLKITRF